MILGGVNEIFPQLDVAFCPFFRIFAEGAFLMGVIIKWTL